MTTLDHGAPEALAVPVVRLPHAEGLDLPAYATAGAAGLDLLAALDAPLVLEPGAFATVPTGLSVALPPGYEGQVRPRSGLAARQGVTVLNAPGTIDADYRGEVGVILINHGAEPVTITRGLRIAQFVVAPVTRVTWALCQHLPETPRGTGGFGSTGVA
ncbi:dUTP diphosphatase [Rhodospira trueperi]|uniref:Deoxyuridine 5'-triphosphate nucleotidohydrolase n=1 Tax=Rhodospira trueperi TaxID=69960 RepID=A0A1G7F0P4_9PROT|nr:dUTP diphosphatase [Rhodospira trueperi]SDE69442.1 dUTP pyrophosphatase [Rhodospira trueperi]